VATTQKKMKHFKTIVASILVISVVMTSCVSTNKGYQSSPVLSRKVELDPIKADITVDEKAKIVGESKSSYFLFFRVSGDRTYADGVNYSSDESASVLSQLNPFNIAQAGRLRKVRGAAAYKALAKGNYDFLVHPNYTMTTKNYLIFKQYVVKVDGYGAKYSNFRTERQKIVTLENGKEIILQDK
jgi:hypothetical protein